ncbi:hypothetical protein KY084_00505 [Stakelama sp. CBK3Z-3]|uniref:Uncharacterized protein n=1 Tax=Stakelama flava TaxID=2860338 RepID=A0ABS6XHH9_9SPHN|nr:hypothetical protein [Stakelama flava]MBW4329359.1 hypothetical protein [Stakelama flava]
MGIVTLIVAVVLIFLAFRFIAGALKIIVILALIAVAAWLIFGGVAQAEPSHANAIKMEMNTDAR